MHEEGKHHQNDTKIFGLTPVFLVSSIAIVIFVVGSLVFREGATHLFGATRKWLTTNFDWWFMDIVNLIVVFCLFLVVSPLGKVRLGGRDAVPEYSNLTWFAMLFAAGIGIGLLFFGVLEPVQHFMSPPLGGEANTDIAIGIAATTYHWGIHGWAVYGIVGLALAFFAYNRGLPLTIRSAFYPLLGERVWGWPGHVIDTLAVFASLFGLATSLGFGAQQVTAGLNYLFEVPATNTTMVVLIIVITSAALISVLTGLNVGIKRLSQFNVIVAFLLLLFIIVVGPKIAIFKGIFTGLSAYISKIRPLSNWVGREDTGFLHGWTTFYWAWWIAWAPFVGTFIARISKGRTVREFIIGVLLLPTLLCLIWFSAFGGTALDQFMNDGYTGVTETVEAYKPELSLFKMLDQLPMTTLVSSIAMLLTIIFFVTSSDSGSLVIDTITAGGKLDAPVSHRVFWCTAEGAVAIVLLLGGGLSSLQAASLVSGFPFAMILLGMAVCIWIGLHRESRELH
ncbi:MAG: BCCT family transporter [Candidatus Poribacteria bacterium]|nr:BCCT family transporter [Candidatus Poribacteria bacterium]